MGSSTEKNRATQRTEPGLLRGNAPSANVTSAHLWRSPDGGLPVLKDLLHGEEGVWVGGWVGGGVCPSEPVSLG